MNCGGTRTVSYVAQPRNSVVENFIAQPASAAGKQAWIALLKSRYADIGALNSAWSSGYTSFDGNEPTSLLNTNSVTTAAADGDKDAFLRQIADQYYKVTTNAIRARDPNHLILGDRHLPPPQYKAVIEAAQPYVDVNSINLYNRNFNFSSPDLSSVDQAGVWGNKPVLITEFTARAADSGLPSNFGNPGPILPTQDGRADAIVPSSMTCSSVPTLLVSIGSPMPTIRRWASGWIRATTGGWWM